MSQLGAVSITVYNAGSPKTADTAGLFKAGRKRIQYLHLARFVALSFAASKEGK